MPPPSPAPGQAAVDDPLPRRGDAAAPALQAPRPVPGTAQLALFPPDELAAAAPAPRPPRARLQNRIRSLLAGTAGEPETATASFWPDSFFDAPAGG